MGFNKRFVCGKGIAAAYGIYGIPGVIEYFTQPDALIIPETPCWAQKVAQELFSINHEYDPHDAKFENLHNIIQQGYDAKIKLEQTAYALKQAQNETQDGVIVNYTQDTIENLDQQLQYYYE